MCRHVWPDRGRPYPAGDTEIIIQVERDLIARNRSSQGQANALRYGEEVKFGGGKVIRDGMGQSR
ncbi:MAG: hypothetical protein R3D63_08720 [Paracoccaceae bacterium]